MHKYHSRELANAIERSQRLEVDLQASARAHRDFQSLAERDRVELEQAYVGALGREVTVASQAPTQESQLQAHEANRFLQERIAGVTSQAHEAMATLATSSDQRLATAAQGSQQRGHLVQQWAEHRSTELQKGSGGCQ